RPREAFQLEFARGLGVDVLLDLGVQALCDQDLPTGRLVREPGREVRDDADRRVVRAALETDLAAGRVAEGDAGAEIEVVAALLPARRQIGHLFPQSAAHPD